LFALLVQEYGPPKSFEASQLTSGALASGTAAADALFTLVGAGTESAASGGVFSALFGLGSGALSSGLDLIGGLF
jgi:hypothetical protein